MRFPITCDESKCLLELTDALGVLYSETDFYRTSAGLTITETSLDNENAELWSVVNPQTMLQWARPMLANRLASTGDEWTEVAGRFNSGTCNNQWIVLDTKKVHCCFQLIIPLAACTAKCRLHTAL